MIHAVHATVRGLMGLAMRALASGDYSDDSVYAYMRLLWVSYSLNVDRQYCDLSETAEHLQQQVKQMRARLNRSSRESGFITTDGTALRKKLATKALHAGSSSEESSEEEDDDKEKIQKYGWGEDERIR